MIESKVNMHCNGDYSNKKTPVKAVSYDNIVRVSNEPQVSKRTNFPYAFLRSKLSVLPEENGGSVINQKRILQEMQLLESSVSNVNSPKLEDKCISKMMQQQQQQQTTETIVNNNAMEIETLDKRSNSEQHSQSQRSPNQRYKCFSSTESGYDSDSRFTEDQNLVFKSSISSMDSAQTPYFDRHKRELETASPRGKFSSIILSIQRFYQGAKHLKVIQFFQVIPFNLNEIQWET